VTARGSVAALLGLAMALLGLAAQAQSLEPAQQVPTFPVTTELVYVRFHVERKGGYLDSLRPDQIRVLEDGRPQTVALL
jgi:hypothetical protein